MDQNILDILRCTIRFIKRSVTPHGDRVLFQNGVCLNAASSFLPSFPNLVPIFPFGSKRAQLSRVRAACTRVRDPRRRVTPWGSKRSRIADRSDQSNGLSAWQTERTDAQWVPVLKFRKIWFLFSFRKGLDPRAG